MCRVSISKGKQDNKYIYQHVVFSTGYSLSPKFWDDEKKQVRKSYVDYYLIESRIAEINKDVKTIETKSKVNGTDLYTDLLNHFKPAKKEAVKPIPQPVEWITDYLERKKSVLKAGTIKNYRNVLNKLISYQSDNDSIITWEMLDYSFLEHFTMYLIEKYKSENSYTAKIIKTIKDFITASVNEGMNVNPNYKRFNPTYLNTETDHIALSLDELKALIHLDLSESPRYENVRDLFVFMCLLGLRYSDLKQLRKEHIKHSSNNVPYLEIRQVKTGEQAFPLLHPKALELWERYKYDFKVPSDVEINRIIKEVGKMAGIVAVEITTKKIGNEVQTENVPRCEMISCHTARRTYVTLHSTVAQIPTETLSKLTGHSNIAMTQQYNKSKIDSYVDIASQYIKNLNL